ncbi:MAG: cyclase family protein [Anaerolineae bacterium]
MRFWDITYPLKPGMATWPGDPAMQLQPLLSLERGDHANTSLITLGSHAGTHLDAPAHVLPGQQTIESLPLAVLLGPAVVIDCRDCSSVSAADLQPLLPAGCQRLLIKTSAGLADQPDSIFPYSPLTCDAAEWLIAQQVLLVGLSSPSVDTFDSVELPVHRILLRAGVVIVERLSLNGVPDGQYQLHCLPLPLVGADGAPVRAVLTDV